MPIYEVVGTLSVPFVVYVERDSEDEAIERVERVPNEVLLANRTSSGTVEGLTATETLGGSIDIHHGE